MSRRIWRHNRLDLDFLPAILAQASFRLPHGTLPDETGRIVLGTVVEFAERMEGGDAKVEPLNGLISKREERRMGYAR